MWFRLLFLPMASAYFIINCNLVALERLDPIVSPGSVSSHVHAVMGGSDFKSTYEYEKSVNAKCTTCVINIDKSNYWVPDVSKKAQVSAPDWHKGARTKLNDKQQCETPMCEREVQQMVKWVAA